MLSAIAGRSATRIAAMTRRTDQIGRLGMRDGFDSDLGVRLRAAQVVVSEIDHALAVIGTAHWIDNFSTGAHPRDRRQSTSTKWQLCSESGHCRGWSDV